MIDLPDFSPLRTTASIGPPTRATLDRLDHLLVVAASARSPALARLPHGKQLASLLARAQRNGDDFASSRATNARATSLTIGAFTATKGFAALTRAARTIRECLRDKPRALGIAFVGFDAAAERVAAESLLAAASAAAFALPEFKATRKMRPSTRLASLRLMTTHGDVDLATTRALALGNNVARSP